MEKFISVQDNEFTHKGFKELKGRLENGAATVLEALTKSADMWPGKKIIGKIVDGGIEFLTFREVETSARRLGAFLESITEDKEIVGIYSINRPEWIISEYGTYFAHCINSPLYSTFSLESLAYVLRETEMKVVIASTDKAISLVENVLCKNTHSIRHIILMDKDLEAKNTCEKAGCKVYFLEDILKNEDSSPTRKGPLPEDLATICYTSGTSGVPKGVMLTHSNIIYQLEAFILASKKYGIVSVDENDVYISYLPLAHVMERIVFSICVISGTRIVFYKGNPKTLQSDFQVIKPSFVTVVPRVLNIFHDKIEERVCALPFLKRLMFRIGMCWKVFMQRFGHQSSWFWDTLVFNKVAAEFGGNLRASLCGGAPVNPNVIRYMQAVLSFKIFQGYGQTEGLGANIVSTMDSTDCASVGVPFPSTKVKLVEDSNLPGSAMHLLMKGPAITKGYYKRNDLTEKSFDKDGWLITGDVAKYENGRFYIVGRSKDLFKTSFGEYITPEVLENEFSGGIIEDIYITYNVSSDYLLAIVVSSDESVTLQDVVNKIRERGSHLVSEKRIRRYEIPSHFVLIRKPFASYENGNFITPSMKKRRAVIENYFANKIKKGFETKY